MQPALADSTPIHPVAGTPESPFADLPVRSPRVASPGGWRSLVLLVGVGAVLVGSVLSYHFLAPVPVDPSAPRVRLAVRGMHCPIQCALRVRNALEALPWVVPDSVTADPKTGTVTFAVTGAAAVEVESVRRAIERAGFGLADLRLPPVE